MNVEKEQADAGRDGRTRSWDQILRRERRQGNNNYPCSAYHEQDWQPYPVDAYSAINDDHTYSRVAFGRLPGLESHPKLAQRIR